jgi:hypothetical protein
LTFSIRRDEYGASAGRCKAGSQRIQNYFAHAGQIRAEYHLGKRCGKAGGEYLLAAIPLTAVEMHFFCRRQHKILAVWHRPCSTFPTVDQLMPGHELNRKN